MPQPESAPPNIVYIYADDLGCHELGSFGQEKIRTPNLDRLAAEGMRLTRHYSGSAVCAPSRCVLLTGKHSGRAIIRGNKEVGGWGPEEPEGQWPLPDEEITLAELLQACGYTTGAFGKWGLGGPGSEGHPCNQGFDHFYGYLCQRVAHNYYPTHMWRNHDVDVLHNNDFFRAHQKINAPLASETAYNNAYRGGDFAPEAMLDEAIGFVNQHASDGPFFLYFPSPIPHLALQAPQEFVDQYPREWDETHYLGDKGYLPNARPRATYAAMITYLDFSVGKIIEALDSQGVLENTIILFSSDNGASWVGGVDMAFFNSLGNLRGRKATLWEGGIRVPTIAWWPGHIEAGTETDIISGQHDTLPTIMDLIGFAEDVSSIPGGIDGISLAPTLLGRPQDQVHHDHLYWEFPEGSQQQAVLMGRGRYKAIRPNLRRGGLAIELYDLNTDPGESNNIAADHPDLVKRAGEIMQREHRPSELFPIKALDER